MFYFYRPGMCVCILTYFLLCSYLADRSIYTHVLHAVLLPCWYEYIYSRTSCCAPTLLIWVYILTYFILCSYLPGFSFMSCSYLAVMSIYSRTSRCVPTLLIGVYIYIYIYIHIYIQYPMLCFYFADENLVYEHTFIPDSLRKKWISYCLWRPFLDLLNIGQLWQVYSANDTHHGLGRTLTTITPQAFDAMDEHWICNDPSM